MAVNATEVLYLTSGLFKAAPSKAILTDLVKFNGTIDGLAASLGTSPYAVNAFPFSNAEKAKVLAENLLGSTVADKAAAVTALEGILNANNGNVGIAAAAGIRAILSDAAFADAKAQLENRVEVAKFYVDSNKGNEISTSILDAVTKDAATVTAARATLSGTTGGNEAGVDRVLTNAQDILTGTAGDDNFRAVAGAALGQQDQTTLNSSDIIDGAAGNDTLIVNLVNGGAAANYGGGARIKNIETLKLGTNNNATFDYNVNQGQNEITDVTTVVADQINTGETLTIRNLVRDAADKALPTLSWINDSTAVNGQAGTVTIAYRAAAVSGTADEQAINLTNVRDGVLNINAGIEKAVVASTGTSTNSIRTIDSITGTTTTLKEVVINAEATAALGEGRIISTAAGTRGLEVARTPANDNTQHVSFVNVGSAVTKVDASGSKGNVNVAFTDTATAVANTFIGGEGNDQVVVNGGNDNLSGGKGNDTFIFGQTNTSANGTFFNNSDTIDGGEGTDTIQFDYGNGNVTIQTSEWLNSKGVDAIDLRGQNNRVQLDDAFVGRADAGSFEVITNKIVQNDAANSVADEVNSRHQIDLSTVGANRAVKVTGGEGRETVIVTDALNGMQTLSGGNGLDVLVVKNGATLTGQDLQNVSGFNVMNLVKTSANAQVFNIDLSASFLTKAIDANAAAGTSVNTANLFRIVTDGADASGTANSLSGVQDIGAGDTINITIDTAGLTAGSGAINVNDLLATNAAVRIRNAAGQDLVTKAAGANQPITVAATAGNIFTAANATATADATYTTTGAASVGTLTTSGQASTGGGGVAPVAGGTFTLTAANALLGSTFDSSNVNPAGRLSSGADTVEGGTNRADSALIVDGTANDGDTLNAALVGGAFSTPTWTRIENINLTTNMTAAMSLLNVSGATSINVTGGAANFSNSQGQTIVLGSGYASGLTADVTTANAQTNTVRLNGTAANTTVTTNMDGTANAQPVINVAANSTLTTLTFDSGNGNAAAGTVNITGSGNLTLGAVVNGGAGGGSTIINANGTGTNAYTGSITHTLAGGNTINAGSGNDDITAATITTTVSGGAGDDTIRLDGTLVVANTTVFDGGLGTDTLRVTGATHGNWAANANLVNITNIENLVFSGGNVSVQTNEANVAFGQTLSVDATALTAAQTFTFDGTNETNGRFNISGGLGVDTIRTGRNGDTVNLSQGSNDNFVMELNTSAGTGAVAGALGIGAGASINVAGSDIITGLTTGDVITLNTAGGGNVLYNAVGAAGNNTAVTAISFGQNNLADNQVNVYRGNYDAATGQFTQNNAGTSSLVVYDADATAATSTFQAVVLVGYATTTATNLVDAGATVTWTLA